MASHLADNCFEIGGATAFFLLIAIALISEMSVDLVTGQDGRLGLDDFHGVFGMRTTLMTLERERRKDGMVRNLHEESS